MSILEPKELHYLLASKIHLTPALNLFSYGSNDYLRRLIVHVTIKCKCSIPSQLKCHFLIIFITLQESARPQIDTNHYRTRRNIFGVHLKSQGQHRIKFLFQLYISLLQSKSVVIGWLGFECKLL